MSLDGVVCEHVHDPLCVTYVGACILWSVVMAFRGFQQGDEDGYGKGTTVVCDQLEGQSNAFCANATRKGRRGRPGSLAKNTLVVDI